MTSIPDVDPLEGQELTMLNMMLAQVYPLAKAGDMEAMDRVLKILTLKRRYQEDRHEIAEEWKL